MTKTATLLSRHSETREVEVIYQRDLEMVDWGFHFSVDSEADAYKAAYIYRYNPHGLIVECANGRWWVTVFNETATRIGLDGTRAA
jgi:hypothetical protein